MWQFTFAACHIRGKPHCGISHSERFEIHQKVAKVWEDTPVSYKNNVVPTAALFRRDVLLGVGRLTEVI